MVYSMFCNFKEILKDDDFEIPMFNKDTMDKLFPNHWRYQNQTGKKKFLSENMNAINELVTKTKVFDVNNNSFRYKWINTGSPSAHELMMLFILGGFLRSRMLRAHFGSFVVEGL